MLSKPDLSSNKKEKSSPLKLNKSSEIPLISIENGKKKVTRLNSAGSTKELTF